MRDGVQQQWDHYLNSLQVTTPDPAMDLMLNRWLVYQVLACRVWACSAFYQSGIDATAQLKARGSKTRIVVLSVYDDPDFLEAALASGAAGYVVKARMATDLCVAIHNALAGRLFVSPSLKVALKLRWTTE